MSRLRVAAYSVSLDGFGAGPRQRLEEPLGVGGEALHEWIFPTRMFQAMGGKDGGETGIDEDFASRAMANLGAWIMGRNMFTASRGPWKEGDSWKGWWGKNPPYHVPVFVLTHHARAPIEMQGGTVFHFVTGGVHEAFQRARDAARDQDIRIGGGASTIRQYLEAKLLDELHVAFSPILLGAGEPLFAGLDLPALGYECTNVVP